MVWATFEDLPHTPVHRDARRILELADLIKRKIPQSTKRQTEIILLKRERVETRLNVRLTESELLFDSVD